MSGFRATLLVMLSMALPVGAVSSCSAVNCHPIGYGAFVGHLVELRGTTATYVVASVVGGEYPTSTARVGQRRVVRYGERDAAVLHLGTSYRVELNGGAPGIDSSMHQACSTGTTFTDGSAVVGRTWWQRNHVALAVVAGAGSVVTVVAVWLRRRMRARGEIGRLAA